MSVHAPTILAFAVLLVARVALLAVEQAHRRRQHAVALAPVAVRAVPRLADRPAQPAPRLAEGARRAA